MANQSPPNLAIAYVHFYVDDLDYWQTWFQTKFQLNITAPQATFSFLPQNTIQLSRPELTLMLSAPQTPADTVAQYLTHHPCGVADVAFYIDQKAFFQPKNTDQSVTLLRNNVGFQHTLIYRDTVPRTNTQIDHLVLNVPVGKLQETVQWYEDKFGFNRQQTFTIKTNYSGLASQVLSHPSGIQLPINQPGDCCENPETAQRSQIQEFIEFNRGAGIQHIALKYKNLPEQIGHFRRTNMAFLDVPATYYKNLCDRYPHLETLPHWPQIQQEKILVDVVRSPKEMLLQIFTQPIFKEPTFFWEFIERKQQAQGFGEGNFQALFEAIEQAQRQRLVSPRP
ncbi:VOC family protein [Picosynechococcus sp. PCC 7117]|uniref:VOC family protein n=1 Tax=Picosynechococcus sp. PCC 7117 TaxID=195498 RepID=UPI000810CA65|nr:VOC family protein [Picosynechococcus sp. PCC 7117]ANV88424.1 glyoxalase [Picosynechococcus sp. PCC 7117]